jgi:hypothetical protein
MAIAARIAFENTKAPATLRFPRLPAPIVSPSKL